MRQILIAGLVTASLIAVASPALARRHLRSPAVAAEVQDRFCLQGRSWGYPGNCEFSTYQQCLWSASGTDAGCGENPQYLFSEPRRGYWPYR